MPPNTGGIFKRHLQSKSIMTTQNLKGKIGLVAGRDVRIVNRFTGPVTVNPIFANDSAEDVRVLEAEDEFRRRGLDTSVTTRRYLTTLLQMEDVNTRQLKAIWTYELKFIPSIGLQMYVPRPPYLMLAFFSSGWLLFGGAMTLELAIQKANNLISLALLAGFLLTTFGFFWATQNLLLPYKIAKRLASCIDRVNAAVALRGDDK